MTRIAVLSDLHPVRSSDTEASFFVVDKPEDSSSSPVDAIFKLIESEQLSVDVLICAGDIGNRGCPEKFKYGWQFLNNLKEKLGAELLVAVPGNHDHDSRYNHSKYDPKYNLQRITPSFPCYEDSLNTHFWAWHYVTREFNNISFHLLNTSAFHGINTETKHGRISELTTERLIFNVNQVDDISDEKINIIVCHHHPFALDRINYKDYEAMDGGHELINEIESSNKSNWMFIHGHLHFPRVVYGHAQGTQGPLIFSAGSFSGPLDPEYHKDIANQFYILDIEDIDEKNLDLRGTFRSWDWHPSAGWKLAVSEGGLPANGGFGFKGSIKKICKEIESLFVDKIELDSFEIYRGIPELKYVTPKDLVAIKSILEKNGVDLEIEYGLIKTAGRMR